MSLWPVEEASTPHELQTGLPTRLGEDMPTQNVGFVRHHMGLVTLSTHVVLIGRQLLEHSIPG